MPWWRALQLSGWGQVQVCSHDVQTHLLHDLLMQNFGQASSLLIAGKAVVFYLMRAVLALMSVYSETALVR